MNQKTVLSLSSDRVFQNQLDENLSAYGYRVIRMEEYSQDMDILLKAGIPDLVIVDILMPLLEGIKLSLNIRKKYDIPLIMLASPLPETNKVRDWDMKQSDHLTDSVDIPELMQWLHASFSLPP
jgi:DNA-binding response OmpR family regulator